MCTEPSAGCPQLVRSIVNNRVPDAVSAVCCWGVPGLQTSIQKQARRSVLCSARPVWDVVDGLWITSVVRFRSGAQSLPEFTDPALQFRVVFQLFGHLVYRVHDRGMVAAGEELADLRERVRGQFTDQVHGKLPGYDQLLPAAFGLQVLDLYAETAPDRPQDLVHRQDDLV